MDAELREYLEAMEQRLGREIGGLKAGQEALREEMVARFEQVEGKIEARAQLLRTEMKAMEKRLNEAIEHRMTDENVAFSEILKLQRRVARLEKLEQRIKALETGTRD